MKILYAIQGTGNGHLSRAQEIIPHLEKRGKTDILISGCQYDISLPFKVKYNFYGLSFIFGKNGGIDFLKTYRKSRLKNLYEEIKKLDVDNYDLVISDFEPVSSWAARKAGMDCIGLSNQAAVLSEGTPQPKKFDPVGKFVLNYYAPCTAQYGFHFKKYNPNIYTPVIRKEIREMKTSNKGHYVIYLPSYSEEKIIRQLKWFNKTEFHVFSKHTKKHFASDNFKIYPIDQKLFMKSMAECSGIICGAGFATPSEALFLEKKLLVIPMKSQYEQQCNAAALSEMGVPAIKNLKKKNYPVLANWFESSEKVKVNYPDETSLIIDRIIKNHT
jgi:uncharacterized protein (TIGR00661 family)